MKTKLTLIILICGLWTMDYRLATAQNIGVDVATPLEKLDVLGGIRIGNTVTNNAGTIRWNTPNFQGYNGTTWIDFNAVGGITTLNGLTGASQTFANGTSGTAPAFSSAGTVHTFKDTSINSKMKKLLPHRHIPCLPAGREHIAFYHASGVTTLCTYVPMW